VVQSTTTANSFVSGQGLPLSPEMRQPEPLQGIDHDALKIYFAFHDQKTYIESAGI
jgi:hypothetical protein